MKGICVLIQILCTMHRLTFLTVPGLYGLCTGSGRELATAGLNRCECEDFLTNSAHLPRSFALHFFIVGPIKKRLKNSVGLWIS